MYANTFYYFIWAENLKILLGIQSYALFSVPSLQNSGTPINLPIELPAMMLGKRCYSPVTVV
jgi:hypothetical protein